MLKNLLKQSYRLLGPVIFVVLVSRVDVNQMLSSLQQVDLIYFGCALLISFPIILLKSYRWTIFLQCHHLALPFKSGFQAYVSSFAWGALTPGQLGEFTKVITLSKQGFETKHLLACSLLDRISELLLIMIFGLIGTYVLWPHLSLNTSNMLPLTLAFLLLISVWVFRKFFWAPFVKKFWEILRIQTEVHYGTKQIAHIISYGTVGLMLQFSVIYLCSISLGLNIEPIFLFSVYFISLIFVALPISISGIGTRDVAYIFLLGKQGIPAELAIALSTLILTYKILSASILYVFAWFSGKCAKQ